MSIMIIIAGYLIFCHDFLDFGSNFSDGFRVWLEDVEIFGADGVSWGVDMGAV